MITFLDGPAASVILTLRRAPLALRVVRSSRGNWDALDLITDTPNPQETVFVYVRVTDVARYHIRASTRSASGFFAGARYPYYCPGPDVKDNAGWQAWTVANRLAIDAFHAQHVTSYFEREPR